ncbi:MAG: aldehyde dehydrogenase family protein [Haloferacaceae archaeon]
MGGAGGGDGGSGEGEGGAGSVGPSGAPDDRPTLPTVSNGEHETIETAVVEGIGGPLADVSRTPRIRVRGALETARTEGFERLQAMPVREVLDCVAGAAIRYEGVGPAGDDRSTYRERVARATGLPAGWVDVSAHWLAYAMRHAGEALRAQSPTGGLDVYDDATYTRERNVGLAWTPSGRVLGATMPGNDPAVYAWPVLALAMKVPVVLRPSDREPFTAVRLARRLLAAGIPDAALHVLPGDREVGIEVPRAADHGMAFGAEAAMEPFRDEPHVHSYGPGRSVAVVARDPTPDELASLARGVARAGGRTCFNLTRIVATGDCDPDRLAADLAARLADTPLGPVTGAETDIPAFPDPERAARVDARADAAGRDVTAAERDGPRLVEAGGTTYLRPTVVRAGGLVEELPFPFAGVTRIERGALPDRVDRAYLGVCIGDDDLERAMMRDPAIRKVYGGRYPAAVDLRETHEEYPASFLYETTTYDPSGA